VAGKAAASSASSLTWLLLLLAVLLIAVVGFLLRPALSAAVDRVRVDDPDLDL
jgi:cbb3-type cytochrome oxidase subunit 3